MNLCDKCKSFCKIRNRQISIEVIRCSKFGNFNAIEVDANYEYYKCISQSCLDNFGLPVGFTR